RLLDHDGAALARDCAGGVPRRVVDDDDLETLACQRLGGEAVEQRRDRFGPVLDRDDHAELERHGRPGYTGPSPRGPNYPACDAGGIRSEADVARLHEPAHAARRAARAPA